MSRKAVWGQKISQRAASPQRRRSNWIWITLASILLLAGLYLLLLILAPVYSTPAVPGKAWNEPVKKPVLDEDRVYIPRLSLNMPFASGNAGVLDNALWHRYAQRGDPAKGGNFILAGHRFELAPTPQETRRKSPLYHIDKVQVGDYIYADFQGMRYQYRVTRNYSVKPTQTEIEAPSTTPKLTMYTCTLGGEWDGREVVEAMLTKEKVDPSEPLKVKSSS
jgi:LPXTG-site transpeptidase (sortase) family protein